MVDVVVEMDEVHKGCNRNFWCDVEWQSLRRRRWVPSDAPAMSQTARSGRVVAASSVSRYDANGILEVIRLRFASIFWKGLGSCATVHAHLPLSMATWLGRDLPPVVGKLLVVDN